MTNANQLAELLTQDVVYLVPSRGRPHNIARLVHAWEETDAAEVAALVVALDDDDPELGGYLDNVAPLDAPAGVGYIVGERLRLGGTLNALAPVFAVDRLGVGFMGDDHVPRSAGWAQGLTAELAAGAAVVYGNDLIHGGALPTAVLIAGAVVRELGYFVPPGAVHLYLDNYWLELGRRLGRLSYRPDVIIEHLHPIAGKAPTDARYAEVNAPDVYAADEARFRRWLAEEADDAIAGLTAALNLNNTQTGAPE